MTTQDNDRILSLMRKGYGYRRIATELSLPINTVKSFCTRHSVEITPDKCENCGAAVVQAEHRKKKRFCCDGCRRDWWQAHKDQIRHKTVYPSVCGFCGKPFDSPWANTRFCSRKCYADSRRKENRHE